MFIKYLNAPTGQTGDTLTKAGGKRLADLQEMLISQLNMYKDLKTFTGV